MKKKESDNNKKTENLPGYPQYPDSEDIFKKGKEEGLVDPEDITEKTSKKRNVKDIKETNPGDDLDVPGSELDDMEEIAGSEDEENNYYSLGGDDHSDLDEEDAL